MCHKGKPGNYRRPIAERFWEKVEILSISECWLWTAAQYRSGYGQFGLERVGKSSTFISAHRMSWELHYGKKVPDGYHVLHSCDNKRCCNPHHLHLGTHADNMKEASTRRRFPSRVGVLNSQARLKEEDVMTILDLRKKGMTYKRLAKLYKVSPATIRFAVVGRTWSHLKR